MKLLIVIPAHNEELNLVRVISNLQQVCPQYAFIVVNDGSVDGTEQICRDMHYPYLSLQTNLGLTGAIQTGMKYAYQMGYDAVLQFDADGQHLPQYIPDLVSHMEQTGCDIVIGSRYLGSRERLTLRRLAARIISASIFLITGKHLSDPVSGMRLFNKRIILQFVSDDNNAPEPDTLAYLFRRGASIREIPVTMEERTMGKSYLSPLRAVKYMVCTLMSILVFQWFREGKELQ